LCLTSARGGTSSASSPDAAATIVVYNQNDPDSKPLADYYAGKRKILADHVVGLDAPVAEEITRADYTQRIQNPLRKIFSDRQWWSMGTLPNGKSVPQACSIHFVALIRGMPLKIAPDASITEPNPLIPDIMKTRNEASVASELACLGIFDYPLNGLIPNPYYHRFSPIADTALGEVVLLVSQLDGVTPDDVRRIIDDSIETERTGLWGWACVDARGITDGGYQEGDQWLLAAAREMQSGGIPVILDDSPDLFDADFPLDHVAIYYGWYAENICGPFAKPGFRFQKGAIAVHIHSFSAETLRDPNRHWCAPFISRGAAATLGNVYEPYLAMTTNLEIFQDRIQSGFTLAESAWMGTRCLSWMNTVIGDPLYRPFGFFREVSLDFAPAGKNKIWKDCRKILSDAGGNSMTAAPAFEAAATKTGNPVYLEFLAAACAVDGKIDQASNALAQAVQMTKDEDDQYRLVLKRVFLLARNKQEHTASLLARDSLTLFHSPEKIQALVGLEQQLNPLLNKRPGDAE